ncbi:MAG: type IX secretion system protein PorQ [Bacteroidia bacterium]
MRKLLLLPTLFACLYAWSQQLGGSTAFTFALIENSARHTALGGVAIVNPTDDPAIGYQNPALINAGMHHSVSLSYANYIADLNHGFASYAYHKDSLGTFLFSVGYFDYGEFTRTNANGEILGVFDASDYNFQIGFSRQYTDKISYGFNGKFLYSVYEAYVATAGAIDAGAHYNDEKNLFTAAVLMKNLGYQFIAYSENGLKEPLPFDLQASISKKLMHNPLRFTLTAHSLHRWNNSYTNINTRNKEIDLETGEIKNQEVGFGDRLMRHVIFNTELVFSDNFQLRMGYNHQRRAELSPENRRAMTGFSWGFGIGIKKLYLSYGSAGYYPGISTHYFSVHRSLSSFSRAKSK